MPSSDAVRDTRAALHRLFWRVHFWAGMITAPLVLFAALTGLLYVLTPQIEARVHARVDRVSAGLAVRPLDEQLAAATAAMPDPRVRSVVPGHAPGARATAVGIPFHRAELGVWNRCLIAAAALAAIFALVTGIVMWWKRRPAQGVGAPPVSASQLRAVPAGLWALTALLAVALPAFGISLVAFVCIELLIALRRRRPAAATPA